MSRHHSEGRRCHGWHRIIIPFVTARSCCAAHQATQRPIETLVVPLVYGAVRVHAAQSVLCKPTACALTTPVGIPVLFVVASASRLCVLWSGGATVPRCCQRLPHKQVDASLCPRDGHTALDAACFRRTNIGLHVLNSVLVTLLSWMAMRHASPHGGSDTAVLAGLLFFLSPMHWGTVMYVYSRSDLLSCTFTLACVACAWRAVIRRRGATHGATHGTTHGVLPQPHRLPGRVTTVSAAAAVPLLVAALASKQTALVAPLLAGACTLWTTTQCPHHSRAHGAAPQSSSAGCSGGSQRHPVTAVCWATARRLGVHAIGMSVLYVTWRWLYFGAVGDLEAESLPSYWPYVSTQPYAVLRYAATLLVPWGLAIDHHLLVSTMPVQVTAVAMHLYLFVSFRFFFLFWVGGGWPVSRCLLLVVLSCCSDVSNVTTVVCCVADRWRDSPLLCVATAAAVVSFT